MATTLLPGFQTISEFGQFHGDCGECATLAALHALDPVRFPLTLDELNHLTSDAIAHGEADAALSGGMNIPGLDVMLTRLGIAHRTVGYAAFTIDQLHADLKANAGRAPVVVEWSQGGTLPGDESGVQFHYSSCGGIDTGPAGDGVGGAYLWADGDNRASAAAPGDPIRYTWAQVQAAAPIAYIVITEPARIGAQAVALTIETDSAGNVTGAHDQAGDHIGAGFALKAEQAGLLGTTITLAERTVRIQNGANAQAATLDHRYLLMYTPSAGVLLHDFAEAAQAVECMLADLDAAHAQITQQAGALATAQTHIADLEAQTSALQDEIAKLQNPPPPPPPVPPAPSLAQAVQIVRDSSFGEVMSSLLAPQTTAGKAA